MSTPARRLLFDECIGKPVMTKLRGLIPVEIELQHLADKFAKGDKDEDWIPRLGTEGGWVVITSDAGRNSKKGQKLPELCLIHRVTHVILSGTLNQKSTLEKINSIAAAWSFFEDVFSSPQGSRYFMRLRTRRGKLGQKGKQVLTVSVDLCKVTAELLANEGTENTQAADG